MSELPRRSGPDAWWLVAGPVTGIVGGTMLGAPLGWLTTPTEGVGPLVGDSVGSMVLGGVVGMTFGVIAGGVVGAVLMFLVGRVRPASADRPMAALVGAVCCPAVLALTATIGRVDLGRLAAGSFALVTIAGAVAGALLAGRRPDRA